jgi:alcohol dehydrogenase YqhD (iron-dependent ADH family)
VAHCLEAWFGKGDATLSDRFVAGIIHEAIEFGPALMADLENYELRARIMWAATNALNNITLYGRAYADWGVHALGHVLSFLFDTPHGASLSIMYPAWMKIMEHRAGPRITALGKVVFGTEGVDDTIQAFKALFGQLGSPLSCAEGGIDRSQRGEILSLMNKNRSGGLHHKLSDQEREAILDLAL